MTRQGSPIAGEQAAQAERALVALLELAHSGERAAAYAYRGHWKSSSDPEERARIKSIEDEEWHHRQQVREMLDALGVRVSRWRELRALATGRVLGALCYVSGWLLPMYGAGKLESHNIREYEAAARHARASGHDQWLDCLLTMAEVEWDHEEYFRARVLQHWLGRRLPIWPQPASRASIRATFGPLPDPGMKAPGDLQAAKLQKQSDRHV